MSNNVSSYLLPINYLPADIYDTMLFNTKVMILAVPTSATHAYTTASLIWNFSGGLSGTLLWPDLSGTGIAVKFNLSAYIAHGMIGVLLLHHLNAIVRRTEIPSVVTP